MSSLELCALGNSLFRVKWVVYFDQDFMFPKVDVAPFDRDSLGQCWQLVWPDGGAVSSATRETDKSACHHFILEFLDLMCKIWTTVHRKLLLVKQKILWNLSVFAKNSKNFMLTVDLSWWLFRHHSMAAGRIHCTLWCFITCLWSDCPSGLWSTFLLLFLFFFFFCTLFFCFSLPCSSGTSSSAREGNKSVHVCLCEWKVVGFFCILIFI